MSKEVCKLINSVYGLKEAPNLWHEKFDKVLISNGYANETKRMLASNFDLKNMGEIDIILGVKITKASVGLLLLQEHYVEKVWVLWWETDLYIVWYKYPP